MNVLFIVTSFWAYGELLIALQFAKRIQKHGFEPYFFIPSSHKKILDETNIPYSVLLPKLGNINRVLLEDYNNNYNPDFIILSDFLNYNFCEKHYGLTTKDLEIFKGRLGTFDNFDWNLTKRKMDTYGFSSKTVSEVDINDFGFQLAPCPIANPLLEDPEEYNKFYYPLSDERYAYNDDIKKKRREEFNLPINQPIVLLTAAVWQETHKLYPHVSQFVATANQVFQDIFRKIAKDTLILYVGPETFLGSKEIPANVRMLNQLSPDQFERYVQACDVFVSRNITSTTLAKVSLSGIPTVMIKNSLRISQGKSMKAPFPLTKRIEERLKELELCYPYQMFPVGWHTFLEPTLQDNPYRNLVTEVELFDEVGTVNTIKSILEDKNIRQKLKTNLDNYNKKLLNLKKPEEILGELYEKI